MKKQLLALLSVFTLATMTFAQPGTLDVTFDTDGIALINPTNTFDNAQDVIVLSNNKILLCGTTGSASDFDMVVIRLNEDGSYDNSFGSGGVFTLSNEGGADFAYDMELLPNGNVIVIGAKSITMADTQFAAWVIKPDGALDPSFSTDGIYETNLDSGEEYINKVLIHDNLIYLVGRKFTAGFSYNAITVQCLDFQGNLNTAFGTNGTASFQTSATDELTVAGAAILAEGGIAICGDKYNPDTFSTQPMIVAMSLTGAPITGFGTNGIWLDPTSSGTYYDIEYSNSKLLVVGTNGSANLVRRHNIDGTLDVTFANNGTLINAVGNYSAYYDCILGADNKWYACGTTGGGFMIRDFVTSRFSFDGVMDATWANNGNVVTSLGASFDDAYGIGIQQDGRVVCAGLSSQSLNDMGVVRYLGDGAISSVNEVNNFNLSVYPNPSNNEITLSTAITGKGRFTLVDMTGRVVLQQEMAFTSSQRLNIQDVPSGIYSLVVSIENKQSVVSLVKL